MVLENLQEAVKILEGSKNLARLIPEVRSNLVMAKKNAQRIEDVAGIPGRITTVNGKVRIFLPPQYGASSHMARLVLSVMKYYPKQRSALNLRYNPKLVYICEKLGLKVSFYNRMEEPEEIKEAEGSTITWGVEQAIKRIKTKPDVIYHQGGWGKEPMLVLIGENAVEVAEMADCLSTLYHHKEDVLKKN